MAEYLFFTTIQWNFLEILFVSVMLWYTPAPFYLLSFEPASMCLVECVDNLLNRYQSSKLNE